MFISYFCKSIRPKNLDINQFKAKAVVHLESPDNYKILNNGRTVSPFIEAGSVAAAILTKQGNIYVGVCIDTASTLSKKRYC